jgi:hypothetical protein
MQACAPTRHHRAGNEHAGNVGHEAALVQARIDVGAAGR